MHAVRSKKTNEMHTKKWGFNTVSTKRKYTLLSSRVLRTEGVQIESRTNSFRGVAHPYFSSSSPGLWVLGFATSVYFILMETVLYVYVHLWYLIHDICKTEGTHSSQTWNWNRLFWNFILCWERNMFLYASIQHRCFRQMYSQTWLIDVIMISYVMDIVRTKLIGNNLAHYAVTFCTGKTGNPKRICKPSLGHKSPD